MKRNAYILVAAIIAVTVAIFFVSRSARFAVSASPSAEMIATVGKPAPEFELETLDGKKVKLSDYRGKAVLINFWATWCAPCKLEMPWLVDLHKQYNPQGLEVIGIAMDDSGKSAIASFVKEMKVDYTILQGKEAVGDAFGGVQSLPETFFVGRDGTVTNTLIGIHSASDFEDNIKRALATGTPPATQPSTEKAGQK